MNAEIITIGDELLIGQVVDTNSSWLGQELSTLGVRVNHKSVVGDIREAILQALQVAGERSELILITGGLGPTKDDITKSTLCEFFQCGLQRNEEVLKNVQDVFRKRKLPMLESNNRQAMLPERCEVLWNRHGTAPGMWFHENGKIFISLPGVPFEMKAIFSEEILPKLKSAFTFPAIVHRTFHTIGIGESFLAKRIAKMEDTLPNQIKLAYLPGVGTVRLRLSAFGPDRTALEQELNGPVNLLYELAGDYIFTEGESSLSEVVGTLLKNKNATVATGESCTGGYLSHLITSVPGSSAYYIGSVISYHNRIKMLELEVPEEILKTEGAVSEVCVLNMADHLRKKFDVTYALATSGIAGPDGGTPDKPVGTVWIALATPERTIAKFFQMGDDRERTIQRTALAALEMLRKELLNLNH